MLWFDLQNHWTKPRDDMSSYDPKVSKRYLKNGLSQDKKIHKEGTPIRSIVNTIGSPTYYFIIFLAKTLKNILGHTQPFVKDSMHLVCELKNLKVNEGDSLVNFNVVSLFTKILMKEAIKAIREVTDEETAKLREICLKSMFFSFKGILYKQIDGIVTGSPLSPMVANIYMESFEIFSIESFHSNLNGGRGLWTTLILIGHMEDKV